MKREYLIEKLMLHDFMLHALRFAPLVEKNDRQSYNASLLPPRCKPSSAFGEYAGSVYLFNLYHESRCIGRYPR